MAGSSSFSKQVASEDCAERLYHDGSTCDTYVIRRFGKLLFKKKLKAECRGKAMYIEAFRKEFETGYSLEHPALPRYVALEEENGVPYILEEYVEGETLTQLIAKHPDSFRNRKNADELIDQLLSAMAYLHGHQVLLLDLKPDNVMITSVGHRLRLVDLGGCLTDTYRGTEALSTDFAAPEQLSGSDNVSERTDIYLIGRLLQYSRVPRVYNKAIERCLKPNPDDRYDDVASLQKAIHNRRFRSKMSWMASALAFVAVIVCAIYFLSPSAKQEPNVDAAKPAATQQQTMRHGALKTGEGNHPVETTPAARQAAAEKHENGANGANQVKAMTAELHREMDKAFARHFASFKSDTVIPARTFYSHSDLYTGEINAVKERLAKRYPDIPSSEIEARYMNYFNKTVLPIWDKVDVGAWK